MHKSEVLNDIKKNKPELKKRFNVKRIGIFGSYARGDYRKDSDLDVLIELNKPLGIFGLMELEDYLGSLIGKKIDLVTKNTLKSAIKEKVLKEAVYA